MYGGRLCCRLVYINGEQSFALYSTEVRRYGIAEGKALAQEDLEQLRTELEKLNLRQTGNVPSQQDDITEKWRFGGYFEVRWNAIDNTFERNN